MYSYSAKKKIHNCLLANTKEQKKNTSRYNIQSGVLKRQHEITNMLQQKNVDVAFKNFMFLCYKKGLTPLEHFIEKPIFA